MNSLNVLLRIACCVSVIGSSFLYSQINTYIKSVRPLSVTEQQPLVVSVGLLQSSELNRVTLHYRQFGLSEYRSVEMQLMRDSAVVEIPANEVLPPFLEIYVVAVNQNGVVETYPAENPEVTPARITVNIPSPRESEIIILSPDQGEQIKGGETYVSVSFVYADDIVDRSRTKIFMNGIDLTNQAVLFGDLLIVPPEAIPAKITAGRANLEVQVFDTTGKKYTTIQRRFAVLTTEQAEELESPLKASGNALAESRSEKIKGTAKTYNRLDARANASYLDFLKANTNITVTSEEKPENQPQNRYFFGLDARYARIGLGDAYPRFPYTIMDGRRVRGYTFDLLLGAFKINAASGELLRRVEINSTPQTLKRNMTVVRPSFGKGEKFQWGFTYSKSKDEFDPTQPIVVRPQENVVFGSDMLIAIDNRRIELTAQSALSLNNVDISSPSFTKDSIDAAIARGTFSKSDGDQLKRFLPILKLFITPNENLIPINPVGGTSLVYETGLAFNYFGNYLKGSYIFHGKDYTSAGATSIRKDIRGFNVIDRLRMLDNRLFLTASFERLENNTSGFEIATTTYKTINTSISYFPSGNYPNVTIGYGRNTSSNPIDPFDTVGIAAQIALRAINDQTQRYFLQTSYDFAYWGQHNLSFNLDISNKDDRTPKQQDVSTFNSLLLVSTTHHAKLESSIGISISSLEFPQVDTAGVITKTKLSYQTVSLTGRYKLYKDVLRLSASYAPTFGDFARMVFESGLQYSITSSQTAALQFQFIANPTSTLAAQTSKNDSYISFLYRIDF